MAQETRTFIEYCITGNIDSIKKMSLKNCDLNMGFRWAWDEAGFRYACMMGRYNIVKYLAELYKNNKNYEKINIHANNEYGFRLAYRNKHYIIVKYLMKLLRKHKYKPFKYYLIIFKKFDKYKL